MLLDPTGAKRAGLSLGADGSPGLILYDATQRPRVTIGIDADGPTIAVANAAGQPRAELAEHANGLSGLAM
jgi:hypothetical protein